MSGIRERVITLFSLDSRNAASPQNEQALFFLTCMFVWIWATSIFRLAELGSVATAHAQAIPLIVSGITFWVVLVLLNLSKRMVEQLDDYRSKPGFYVALACVGALGEAFGHMAFLLESPALTWALCIVGVVLASASFALATLLLWTCYRYLVLWAPLLFIPLTFAAASIILVVMLPLRGFPLQIVCPLPVFILLWLLQRRYAGRTQATSEDYVFRFTNKNAVSNFLMGFSFGASIAVIGGDFFLVKIAALVCVAAIASMALSMVTKSLQRNNLNTAMYEVGIPLLALSWLAIALGLPREVAFLLQFIGLLYLIFVDQTLILVLLGEYAVPPSPIIFMYSYMLIGLGLGLVVPQAMGDYYVNLPIIMVAVLLLASTWLVKDRKLKFGWVNVNVDPMDTSRDFFRYACKLVGHERSLTAREQEVLQRLAMGQNRSSISRDLFISEETVKSHTKNIYRKLDVHSRQELIDLVGEKVATLMKE